MAYGLRITPEVGGKSIVMDAGSRYASYHGYVQFTGAPKTVGFDRPILSGATSIVIPRQLGVARDTGRGYATLFFVNSLQVNQQSVTWSSKDQYTSGSAFIGDADIFSIAGVSSPGGYGIRITNGSNFMEINDSSYIGYVSYVGWADIYGSWQIPQDVLNRGSYVVFARWDNQDAPLYLDRASNTIQAYGSFSSASGSAANATVTGVQLVIVSCGSQPENPSSGYGLVIRNAYGQTTFSSKFPPLMYDGSYYGIPGVDDYDGSTGEANRWVGRTGGASQPMVPLCSLGIGRGDYTRNSGQYQFRPLLLSGIKMSGGNICVSRAKPGGADLAVNLVQKQMICAYNLPCIDAANYF